MRIGVWTIVDEWWADGYGNNDNVKTWNNLYDRICDLDNLWLAAKRARKGKTRRIDVETFDLRRESEIRVLQEELLSGVWRPRGYRSFRIFDPKVRVIHAAPYRDRVVHHALCNVIGPILQSRFIRDTYSCQQEKGTGAARERCRYYTNRHKYVLKCDIRKYYQSIDHAVLMAALERTICCSPTLELCRLIVTSYQDTEVHPGYFPGDDLLAVTERPHGVPIGNLTSQLWANFLLDPMDHTIKEVWRAPGYARYTDDWLVWHDRPEPLWDVKNKIETLLTGLRLRLHMDKTQVMATESGVPFLGFRFRPGFAPRVLGQTKRRFERRSRCQSKLLGMRKVTAAEVQESRFAWKQFARYGNTTGLLRKYVECGFGWTGQRTAFRSGSSGGVLEQQQSGQSSVRQPEQERSDESQQQQRVSLGGVALSA
jgi:retron-type reverse transcriptase